MGKSKRASKETAAQEMTIIGFVDEYDLDEDTAGVKITTEDEEEYIVKLDRKGKELLDLVDEEVEITGAVQADDKGNLVLTVKRYEILEYDYEEDEEDDYDDFDEDDDEPRSRKGRLDYDE